MTASGAPSNHASLYVTADSDSEAAELVMEQFKAAAIAAGHRGFSIPELTHEDIVLVDGAWTHAYEFTTEFLPGAS